jgi:molybdopterin-synthase adenylyltransferase
MATFKLKKPQLPSHYYVRFEPPDRSGDEQLHFTSERRKITLKGHAFREFQQRVIPLLDGTHTWEKIQDQVSDIFAPENLQKGLELLAENHLLRDASESGTPAGAATTLEPQLNFWHEMNMDAQETQQRLAGSTVTIIGLGGAGASAASSLGAASVGALRCIDPLPVSSTDPYLSSAYSLQDLGTFRAEVVRDKIAGLNSAVRVDARLDALDSDEEVLSAIQGSSFVLCCVDPGYGSIIYKLNRACLKARIPWTSCFVSGFEGVLGPTVHPYETPCYLCYKMRSVACAENPEDEFAFQRFLDRRKHDDSGRRENLVFGVGMMGNLAGLEVMKALTAFQPPSSEGRIVVVDFLDVTSKKHLVLRKPWCPACGVPAAKGVAK